MADSPDAPASLLPSAPQPAAPPERSSERSSVPASAQTRQRNNPLHGLTLQHIVEALVLHHGWPGLAERVPLRCFSTDPSVASSLKFLRKTPWARTKVEGLYLFMQREQRRAAQR